MPTLTIRNVSPDLHDALKQLADEHGRSLNSEVLQLLERAVGQAGDADRWRQALEHWIAYQQTLPPVKITEHEIREAIREGRM
ncbi:MAG: Arc family DNA-binding protein [Rhodothermales bacterium]|nr:Arc family DNA-binding protein [Rhodothermales bacterium]MBO6780978.1 Arc family DNA-binding protein [Rhodothermales bacterium]